MNTKTYIEKAKDKEILKHILESIAGSNSTEDEFAAIVSSATDDEITEGEFHDWIASFDLNDYFE
jgi:hypothetical protein